MKLISKSIFCFSLFSLSVFGQFRIINGEEAQESEFPAVVHLAKEGCTAVIVGKNVLLTTGRCGKSGEEIQFHFHGDKYLGIFEASPVHSGLSVIYTQAPVTNVTPISIQEELTLDDKVTLVGFGCSQVGGSSGKLYSGKGTILSVIREEFLVGKGTAACFGDGGGTRASEKGRKNRIGGNLEQRKS